MGVLEEIENMEVDSEKRELKNICEELMRGHIFITVNKLVFVTINNPPVLK